jgi:hypothetical protein
MGQSNRRQRFRFRLFSFWYDATIHATFNSLNATIGNRLFEQAVDPVTFALGVVFHVTEDSQGPTHVGPMDLDATICRSFGFTLCLFS